MTGLALRHVPLRPLPGWRLAIAVLVLGAAVAGAVVLQTHVFVSHDCGTLVLCSRQVTPGWVNPATIALLVLGVAGAVGVLATRSSPE